MAYTTDADLEAIRPDILNLGVSHWEDKRSEADQMVNRDLNAHWYQKAAWEFGFDPIETPFDPSLFLNASTQLKRLSILKALELIYESLSKGMADDPFSTHRDYFAKEYDKELRAVIGLGLDYDWNKNGTVDLLEKETKKPELRTLERI